MMFDLLRDGRVDGEVLVGFFDFLEKGAVVSTELVVSINPPTPVGHLMKKDWLVIVLSRENDDDGRAWRSVKAGREPTTTKRGRARDAHGVELRLLTSTAGEVLEEPALQVEQVARDWNHAAARATNGACLEEVVGDGFEGLADVVHGSGYHYFRSTS